MLIHRFVNEAGVSLIKHFEGFSDRFYYCPGGWATIGYGHKLETGERYDAPISLLTAEELLRQDTFKAERAVIKYIDVELSNNQFAALVSFTFNLGAAALQRSSLRHKLNYGLYEEAAVEFLKWVYAGGQKINGLIKRRFAESNLFMNNQSKK